MCVQQRLRLVSTRWNHAERWRGKMQVGHTGQRSPGMCGCACVFFFSPNPFVCLSHKTSGVERCVTGRNIIHPCAAEFIWACPTPLGAGRELCSADEIHVCLRPYLLLACVSDDSSKLFKFSLTSIHLLSLRSHCTIDTRWDTVSAEQTQTMSLCLSASCLYPFYLFTHTLFHNNESSLIKNLDVKTVKHVVLLKLVRILLNISHIQILPALFPER